MIAVNEAIKCGAVVVVDEDDAYPCGALSRYLVERSDGDKSYGENGGSAEACEDHLSETVAEMVDGDAEVRAIVTIRWDADCEDAEPEPQVAECSYCTTRITLLGGHWTADDGTTACTDTSAPYVAHKPKEG